MNFYTKIQGPRSIILTGMMRITPLPPSSKPSPRTLKAVRIFCSIWHVAAVTSTPSVTRSLTCSNDQWTVTWTPGRVRISRVTRSPLPTPKIGPTFSVYTLTCHSDPCLTSWISCRRGGGTKSMRKGKRRSKASCLTKWKARTRVQNDSWWWHWTKGYLLGRGTCMTLGGSPNR